jgi:hypothetical protein
VALVWHQKWHLFGTGTRHLHVGESPTLTGQGPVDDMAVRLGGYSAPISPRAHFTLSGSLETGQQIVPSPVPLNILPPVHFDGYLATWR